MLGGTAVLQHSISKTHRSSILQLSGTVKRNRCARLAMPGVYQEGEDKSQNCGRKKLIEAINFQERIARSAIGSPHDSSIRSGGQSKHYCRIERIWRRESIPLDEDGVAVALPVVIGRDRRSVGIVDCENGIAERSGYTKRA